MEENNIRDINDIIGLKNQSIVEDIVKDKQERIDKDINKIMDEFPVEAPKVVQPKRKVFEKNKQIPKFINQLKQDKPYSTKLNTKKKFSFFKKKKKVSQVEPEHQKEPVESLEIKKTKEPRKAYPKILNIPQVKKKGNFSKLIIPLVLIIVIFAIAFVMTFRCDYSEGTDLYAKAKAEATGILIGSIKNQIIINGYAEIFDGDIVIKLAPYTG